MKTDIAPHPLKLRTRLSLLILLVGALLMARQMYADDEPGAIPLLLVLVGVAWFLVTRARTRRAGKGLAVESAG
jgi:hypothetical protein